jgi:hypothetical protein
MENSTFYGIVNVPGWKNLEPLSLGQIISSGAVKLLYG